MFGSQLLLLFHLLAAVMIGARRQVAVSAAPGNGSTWVQYRISNSGDEDIDGLYDGVAESMIFEKSLSSTFIVWSSSGSMDLWYSQARGSWCVGNSIRGILRETASHEKGPVPLDAEWYASEGRRTSDMRITNTTGIDRPRVQTKIRIKGTSFPEADGVYVGSADYFEKRTNFDNGDAKMFLWFERVQQRWRLFSEINGVLAESSVISHPTLNPSYQLLWTTWTDIQGNALSPTISMQSTTKSRDGECPNKAMRSHECGFLGISEYDCRQRDCCWDPGTGRPGQPWCYKKRRHVVGEQRCPVDRLFEEGKREECNPFLTFLRLNGANEINAMARRDKCEKMGCCWSDLGDHTNTLSCFHKPYLTSG